MRGRQVEVAPSFFAPWPGVGNVSCDNTYGVVRRQLFRRVWAVAVPRGAVPAVGLERFGSRVAEVVAVGCGHNAGRVAGGSESGGIFGSLASKTKRMPVQRYSYPHRHTFYIWQ